MNLMKGASVPLVSTVFVLVCTISIVATMVTAVVAAACRQRPDLVGSCGEDFQSFGAAGTTSSWGRSGASSSTI